MKTRLLLLLLLITTVFSCKKEEPKPTFAASFVGTFIEEDNDTKMTINENFETPEDDVRIEAFEDYKTKNKLIFKRTVLVKNNNGLDFDFIDIHNNYKATGNVQITKSSNDTDFDLFIESIIVQEIPSYKYTKMTARYNRLK